MATLRAWERRYDFPEASRTSGGHRLYSEHDIMRLRWVKSRIAEGMQTAQAIQALRHQEASGLGLAGHEPVLPVQELARASDESTLSVYQDRLFHALVSRDLARADVILGEALAISSPEDLILHAIGPALARIGDAWERNEITVAIEHLATNYLRQRLLMWMVSGPPSLPVKPVILACAPDEWHEGSLLMFGALLRRQRRPVAYLGQAVPLKDLASFTKDIRPSAVVIVAMTESSATALIEWPQWMPEAAATGSPVVCYGGRIFTKEPEWQMKMPGVYLGSTIQQGIAKLENLLKS
jgi:DNA-binding transcriptional MerR regulator